jgi:hypothetical protein
MTKRSHIIVYIENKIKGYDVIIKEDGSDGKIYYKKSGSSTESPIMPTNSSTTAATTLQSPTAAQKNTAFDTVAKSIGKNLPTGIKGIKINDDGDVLFVLLKDNTEVKDPENINPAIDPPDLKRIQEIRAAFKKYLVDLGVKSGTAAAAAVEPAATAAIVAEPAAAVAATAGTIPTAVQIEAAVAAAKAAVGNFPPQLKSVYIDDNGDIFYILPNGKTSWDPPEGIDPTIVARIKAALKTSLSTARVITGSSLDPPAAPATTATTAAVEPVASASTSASAAPTILPAPTEAQKAAAVAAVGGLPSQLQGVNIDNAGDIYYILPNGDTSWDPPAGISDDEIARIKSVLKTSLSAAGVITGSTLDPPAAAAATTTTTTATTVGGRRKKRTLRKSKNKRSPRSKKHVSK